MGKEPIEHHSRHEQANETRGAHDDTAQQLSFGGRIAIGFGFPGRGSLSRTDQRWLLERRTQIVASVPLGSNSVKGKPYLACWEAWE